MLHAAGILNIRDDLAPPSRPDVHWLLCAILWKDLKVGKWEGMTLVEVEFKDQHFLMSLCLLARRPPRNTRRKVNFFKFNVAFLCIFKIKFLHMKVSLLKVSSSSIIYRGSEDRVLPGASSFPEFPQISVENRKCLPVTMKYELWNILQDLFMAVMPGIIQRGTFIGRTDLDFSITLIILYIFQYHEFPVKHL